MAKNIQKPTAHALPVHNAPTSLAHDARAKLMIKATDEQRLFVDKYKITGIELGAILKEFGASQAEFAKTVDRSAGLVSAWVNGKYRKIPYRFAMKLQEFVGEDIYITTLENLRSKKLKREMQNIGEVE